MPPPRGRGNCIFRKRAVRQASTSGMAVLNAADPMVAAMANSCPGQVTFFALDSHHPVIATHRAQGKRVLFLEDDQIVAMQGPMQVRIPLSDVPLTRSGAITFQIENAMASIAAAWAVGRRGEPLYPVVGGDQREMAFRLGVNIVMYALCLDYKTDQVHLPSIMERLVN